MAQQLGIVKGDVLQRIGSVGFIIGAILMVIFALLWPRPADPTNAQEVLTKWGEQEVLIQVCSMLAAVGIWALMLGMAGVYRSISAGAGAAWARLGFYGIAVGTAIWMVHGAMVLASAREAANWLAAPVAGQATAYSVVAAIHAVGGAVETMAVILYWLALVLLGVGMVLSTVYPRWMGWVGIVLGIATVAAVGIVSAFAGPPSSLGLINMVLWLLTIVWALVVGIWVARKAW